MKRYYEAVQKVQELLQANPEWESRYTQYIDVLQKLNETRTVQEAQKQFSIPAPFQLYMPLSMAKDNYNTMLIRFDLRFHGQSVGKLHVDIGKRNSAELTVSSNTNISKTLHLLGMNDAVKKLEELAECSRNWHSEKAKEFRRIYAELEAALTQKNLRLTGQPEHDMESWLLKNYAQTSSAQKEVSYIQPVTMLGSRAFFQMQHQLGQAM